MIDDSLTVRAAARRELEGDNYRVIETDNPIAVPYIVWKERPDLLLLDVNMPAMNGDQVAKLMGLETRKQVIILLYSSLGLTELRRLARLCGADGSIQKTGRPGELVEALRKWVE
ncbi:MAG: response regulator [Deltaproteobacteria bacterium]|nr:response regulator [Deltaproteobacteria bacterium]